MFQDKDSYQELVMDFWESMQALHKTKIHREIIESLEGEMIILQYLKNHVGDTLPSDIGCEVKISSARVAAALRKMESKQLITRENNVSDRRKVLVKLTLKGEELARTQSDSMKLNIENLLSNLSKDDASEFVRIIGELANVISEKHK